MFRGTEIKRVLLAPHQADEQVRLLTLEMYDDGLVLRFVLPRGIAIAETAEDMLTHPTPGSFVVRDDVGTDYEWRGMTAGGGDADPEPIVHGLASFIPAIPPNARKLTVVTPAGAVDFDLR